MENESLIPKMSSSSIFYALASFTLVVIVLIYFGSIFKPIVIAFLIWFIINQLKLSLGKIKIRGKSLPSLMRSILAFIIIFLILSLVVELLIQNIEGIVATMPEYLSNFDNAYDKATALINNPNYTEYLQEWLSKLDLSAMATSLVSSLSGIVASSAVVLIYVIFFLMEDASHKIKLEKLFPKKGHQYVKFMHNLRNISDSISYFIASMAGISLVTGAVSYVILIIMGVEYAFLWSFLIFILNFIPYIGPLISSILPAIFAVIITGQLMQFIYVFAVLEVIQIIIGNFIQPMIQGKGTNLAPVTIIVALAFWGMIWGIVGMILAVPIMAVIVIVCSQIPSTRYLAIILSAKGDIPDMED
ncbi:MAG: AI-2E family transporter [Bacteroidetes bacterium]|nr:AI-2E family transporter [Bacteroidota bacterium]MCK5765892.1 AI-2E family transporter [Bacteroidales bacterium]